MSELDAFLGEAIPRQVEAERAIHDGDVALRAEMMRHVALSRTVVTTNRIRSLAIPITRIRSSP